MPVTTPTVTCIVHSFPSTHYADIPSGMAFLLCVLKKQNIIVKQGIMQLLLKQDRLHALTAPFPFLKNPSPKPPLPKVEEVGS